MSITTVLFLPMRATRSGERARFVGLFQECAGLWTAGCWLARRLHQLTFTTHGPRYFYFLILVQFVALRRGENISKHLGEIKGCKYKTSSWHLNGFPDENNIGSTV